MRIGLDFDNVIADFDKEILKEVLLELKKIQVWKRSRVGMRFIMR